MNDAEAPETRPALVASYAVEIHLRQSSEIDPAEGLLEPLKLAEFEGVIKGALEDYGYTVSLKTMRTDR